MTINKKVSTVITATILTFTLAGCSNNKSTQTKKNNQISVTYTLKDNKKTLDSKTVKVNKKAKVLTGLQKAWKVKLTKGFITSIDGHSQNPKKKIYWTYTINGKWAQKGANQQVVNNKDKVKFTLAKVK